MSCFSQRFASVSNRTFRSNVRLPLRAGIRADVKLTKSVRWQLLGLIGSVALLVGFQAPDTDYALECEANLKRVGMALDMYSADNSGHYPPDNPTAHLVPKYLPEMPECPFAKTDTYKIRLGPKAPYNSQNYQDYYFLNCDGGNHGAPEVQSGYPQYNGIVGLATWR